MPDVERFRDRPKVVLHDHLDGGVRPATVLDLAAQQGVEVPTEDEADLAEWFTIAPGMPFEEAWQRFHLVIRLLQDADSLRRVAREAVVDVAADGVVYLETRFGPLSHRRAGLSADDVMAAVADGLADGERATGTVARMIVCGIREDGPALGVEAAELAGAWAGRGVVGYDIAGAEPGHPAADFAQAYRIAGDAGLGRTVHAGEMDGLDSIGSALRVEPDRIGHGWRLADDLDGPVAREVRDRGLPLEVCVTSNACLGLPVDQHPVRRLRDAGFVVTVNPDDRAITTTSTSRELALWAEHHGFSDAELADVQRAAVAAAFCDDETRARVAERVDAGWA
ncbi:MAG TPA: adenosine deaminase [Acidimicrobiales bacterium]|nr:adenosine deaminase [Acidimicrobiales bacterium]